MSSDENIAVDDAGNVRATLMAVLLTVLRVPHTCTHTYIHTPIQTPTYNHTRVFKNQARAVFLSKYAYRHDAENSAGNRKGSVPAHTAVAAVLRDVCSFRTESGLTCIHECIRTHMPTHIHNY